MVTEGKRRDLAQANWVGLIELDWAPESVIFRAADGIIRRRSLDKGGNATIEIANGDQRINGVASRASDDWEVLVRQIVADVEAPPVRRLHLA
jgi:hypothetical protein